MSPDIILHTNFQSLASWMREQQGDAPSAAGVADEISMEVDTPATSAREEEASISSALSMIQSKIMNTIMEEYVFSTKAEVRAFAQTQMAEYGWERVLLLF